MDIHAVKLELVRLILDTENPGILDKVRRLFKNSGKADFWDDLTPLQHNEILQGMDEIEKGETVDYEDFMKKYR